MITAKVTDALISAEALAAIVKSDSAGALVTFSGDVRNHDKGRKVSSLTYEIHPSAQRVLEKITDEVSRQHQVENVAIAHRFGAIPIGESAFVVAVSAAHRAAASRARRGRAPRARCAPARTPPRTAWRARRWGSRPPARARAPPCAPPRAGPCHRRRAATAVDRRTFPASCGQDRRPVRRRAAGRARAGRR